MKSVTQKILVGDLLEDSVLGHLAVVFWTEYLFALPFVRDRIPTRGEFLRPVENEEDDSISDKYGCSGAAEYIDHKLAAALQDCERNNNHEDSASGMHCVVCAMNASFR